MGTSLAAARPWEPVHILSSLGRVLSEPVYVGEHDVPVIIVCITTYRIIILNRITVIIYLNKDKLKIGGNDRVW